MWVIENARLAGVSVATPAEDAVSKNAGTTAKRKMGSANGRSISRKKNESFAKPERVPAKTIRKAGASNCGGKQIYLSGGRCYSCPKGYRRFSPTRKMTHPQACTQRGWGSKKTRAKYAWELNGCRKGEFRFKGHCNKCPSGTTAYPRGRPRLRLLRSALSGIAVSARTVRNISKIPLRRQERRR